jgi:hypothetical protein
VWVSGSTRFDIKMVSAVTLRGRVLDPEGKPADGIAVHLTGARNTMTDEDGSFVFENVRPGSLKLWATPNPQAKAKDDLRVVTTYYPSVVEPEQAQLVRVDGADLFGYDIRLKMAPRRRVRGVVIGADGSPEVNAAVRLLSRTPLEPKIVIWPLTVVLQEDQAVAEHVDTGDDGTFDFPEVPEGDWQLRAVGLGHEPDSTRDLFREGAVELKVGRSDIENIEIRTKSAFSIDVSVDWGDSPPAKLPRLLASLAPLDGQFSGRPEEGFPGRYFVGPSQAVAGYYLAAAMMGGRDVLGQVVELSGPTSLKMIFKTDGGSVRGTVEHGANAMVVLMADATVNARFGISGRCDGDGRFVIGDVPPGEYTVVAFPRNGSMKSVELLNLVAASGRRVKVEAGAAAQVELRMSK